MDKSNDREIRVYFRWARETQDTGIIIGDIANAFGNDSYICTGQVATEILKQDALQAVWSVATFSN